MSESLEEFYTNLLDIKDPSEVASIKRDSKSKSDRYRSLEGRYSA